MNPARWPAGAQLVLAFAAGGVSVLGFAPFGFGMVALAATALLFHLWRHPARPGLNAWTGYAFGLGLLGFGVFWLRISIAQFGGVTLPLAIAITLLFVILMALYYALAGWSASACAAAPTPCGCCARCRRSGSWPSGCAAGC